MRNFFQSNSKQLKTAFIISFGISAIFGLILDFTVSAPVPNLIEKFIIPLATGLVGSTIILLVAIIMAAVEWVDATSYFNKQLALFITDYKFEVIDVSYSLFYMSKKMLIGKLKGCDIIISLDRNNIIAGIEPIGNASDYDKKVVYTRKQIKNRGVDYFLSDIINVAQINNCEFSE